MNRWRHVTCWRDYVVFWRGLAADGRAYRLTQTRRRRLEALLAGATVPAQDGQTWVWSWNDWNWEGER